MIWTYAYICFAGGIIYTAASLVRYLFRRYTTVMRFSDPYLCSRVDPAKDWHVLEETMVIPESDRGGVYGQKEAANAAFLYAGNHDTTPEMHHNLRN